MFKCVFFSRTVRFKIGGLFVETAGGSVSVMLRADGLFVKSPSEMSNGFQA